MADAGEMEEREREEREGGGYTRRDLKILWTALKYYCTIHKQYLHTISFLPQYT